MFVQQFVFAPVYCQSMACDTYNKEVNAVNPLLVTGDSKQLLQRQLLYS